MQILEDNNAKPTTIEYLTEPPDENELKAILSMLGLSPRELMRKGETVYTELGLDDENLSNDELISAMIQHPILIERPIVIKGNKAIIGRPPESVLDIL